MHSLALFYVGVALLGTSSIACTRPSPAGDGDQEPDEGILSGSFDGQRWKFVGGASDKISPESNTILATLGSEPVDNCVAHGVDRLVVKIPFKPGVYPLNLGQTVKFVSGDDAFVATEGKIIVHEVTEDTVRAGLYAIYNDNPDYEVSGQFYVERCFYY